MLQKLSYLNIMLAIIYVLFYFKSISVNTVGIFLIIIFNWLALRSVQQENYKWSVWHYLAGLWSFYYIAYNAYGIFNIISSSFEYGFVSTDVNTYLIFGSLFVIAIISQMVLFVFKSYSNK